MHGLNLTVGHGELVALVGPSGCGKTTTLGFITGFIRAKAGRVLFDGVDVTGLAPQRRGIGYVFQDYAIYPHMTVRENIRFPLDASKMERKQAERDVDEIAGLMGVGGVSRRRPHQLSGGQRQRVALARALVKKPVILLLDEPLSNLDAHLRVDVRAEIRRLQLDLKMTTVFVTHDQAEAMAIADRVAVMSDGKIVALTAPTTLYVRPPSLFSAQFIGSPQINVWAIDGPDGALARVFARPLVARGSRPAGRRPPGAHPGGRCRPEGNRYADGAAGPGLPRPPRRWPQLHPCPGTGGARRGPEGGRRGRRTSRAVPPAPLRRGDWTQGRDRRQRCPTSRRDCGGQTWTGELGASGSASKTKNK